MSNLQHPNPRDATSGTEFVWRDEDDQFDILTWYGYSAETGEYRGIVSTWSLDTSAQTIHLEHVSVRQPYSGWDDSLTNPAKLLPGSHKRKAREIGRERFGKGKFKRLRLYPQR